MYCFTLSFSICFCRPYHPRPAMSLWAQRSQAQQDLPDEVSMGMLLLETQW